MQLAPPQVDYYKYARVISKLLELTQKNMLRWNSTGLIAYETTYANTRVTLSAPALIGLGSPTDLQISIVFTDLQSNIPYTLYGLSGLSSLYQVVYEQTNPHAGLESILDRIITS